MHNLTAGGADARRHPAKRALFVVSHSSAGGAQELWVNLASGFDAHGIETRLLALYPDRQDVRRTPAHLPWHYAAQARPKGLMQQFRVFSSLVAILREYRPDYILTALPAANVIVAVAARIAGLKARVLISHHAPVSTNNPTLDRIDGVVGGSSLVDDVICVSEAVRASLGAKSSRYRAKSRVITNALPREIESLIAGLAAEFPHDRPRGRIVAATGRLASQKNYPTLIRAARHMPDVTIRIIGTGPDEAALRALASELDVADRIEFLGFMERGEAMRTLAQADIFAQPSLFEGHSLGLVEAMKLGLPVVVSNVPSQMEGITDADGTLCGLHVERDDDRALARASLSLLDDPALYAEYASRARLLGSRATFDTMIDRYLTLVQGA